MGAKNATRVLLVEDNRGDAVLVSSMLADNRAHDFEITHVGRLSAAWERLVAEAYDVVLLDLELPDSCGLESLRAILGRTGGVPIVVLTGNESKRMEADCLTCGAFAYLAKNGLEGGVLQGVLVEATASRRSDRKGRPGAAALFKLRLYVMGQTGESQRAVDNLDLLCRSALAGHCEVEVIDILEEPAMAARERILATPTLVKRLPEPARKLIGDLGDPDKVLLALDISPLPSGGAS